MSPDEKREEGEDVTFFEAFLGDDIAMAQYIGKT
jgi:hypothetical protein